MIRIRTARLKSIAITIWLCTLIAFIVWFEMDTRLEERKWAVTTAESFFQQAMTTIQWYGHHDGIYVPVTPRTQPNEYLPATEPTLKTGNGTWLTRLDPITLTRQISNLLEKQDRRVRFHITSLDPVSPRNKATEWEEAWLKAFKEGNRKEGEFYNENGKTWFRHMVPLHMETVCVKCHAQHGYKEGDLRGGMSIALALPPHNYRSHLTGYISLGFVGFFFIFVAAGRIEKKQRLFDATFNSPVSTSITGLDHSILMANDTYWSMFGPPPGSMERIKCHEHRPGKMCHTDDCPLNRVMQGEGVCSCEAVMNISGISRHFIVTSKSLLDKKKKLVGCVESFQEITNRKRMEEELRETNRRLETLSVTDGLTGLANRRHFDEVLDQEYKRHARKDEPLSLILLDIDFFKQFNDTYGHVAGDNCLQQVARALKTCVNRAADLPARYGGEEFACILPETGRRGAVQVAEKTRRAIAALAIPHMGSKIADRVTASLGVVTAYCSADESATHLLAQVDDLLYRAKESGRNRVESLSPDEIEDDIITNFVKLA